MWYVYVNSDKEQETSDKRSLIRKTKYLEDESYLIYDFFSCLWEPI